MKKSKLEIYTVKSENNNYIIHRYFDDANKNYEYQIYRLVNSTEVAREFGIQEFTEGRITKLSSREMCDKLITKIKQKSI
jgi:hypothetical protein